jgi:hypothetical protein
VLCCYVVWFKKVVCCNQTIYDIKIMRFKQERRELYYIHMILWLYTHLKLCHLASAAAEESALGCAAWDSSTQLNTLCHEFDGFLFSALLYNSQCQVGYADQRVWVFVSQHSLPHLHHLRLQLVASFQYP